MMDPDSTLPMIPEKDQLERNILIDRICRRFECDWTAGNRLSIETTLSTADGADHDDTLRRSLLSELIVLDVVLRTRCGETPRLDDYVSRFSSIETELDVTAAFRNGLDWSKSAEEISDGPPDRIGDYRVIREIGRGGMGKVAWSSSFIRRAIGNAREVARSEQFLRSHKC